MRKASEEDLLKLKQSLIAAEYLKAEEEIAVTVAESPAQCNASSDSNGEKKAKLKEKLSIEEQIEYLKYKGITFNHHSSRVAREVLTDRTYYYKVTAFRKNFYKDATGKYINVDFAILNDLAVIDMHLRYLFIKLSLDIEHNIKTLMIHLLTESDEDGYEIIDEYKEFQLESYRKKLKKQRYNNEEIQLKLKTYQTFDKKLMNDYRSPRDYSYDLWSKRKEKPSIWVLIELMTYGQLCFFINFYTIKRKYKYRELNLANSLLLDSKNIRDASAHSRPIIFNMIGSNQFVMPEKSRIKIKLRNYIIQECNINSEIANVRLRNLKIHDISALIYLHDHYVKGKVTRIERKKELVKLARRCRFKKSYYEKHPEFGEVIYILLKLIRKYRT